jgi:hypothetical protein
MICLAESDVQFPLNTWRAPFRERTLKATWPEGMRAPGRSPGNKVRIGGVNWAWALGPARGKSGHRV